MVPIMNKKELVDCLTKAGAIDTLKSIDTGPLPPVQAAATRKLLLQMQKENPWIVGYGLSGSYGNPETVFPEADVDINWLGAPGQYPTILQNSHEFRLDGVDFHFSNRFFGAQIDPDRLRLAGVIVAYRWHVLWENDAAISAPQHTIAHLLTQSVWRADRLSDEFTRTGQELAEWCKLSSWKESQAGELDFFWCAVFRFVSLLSPVDLRAASLARKGLFEIVDILRRTGLTEAEDMAFRCVGAHDFSSTETNEWFARAEQWCARIHLDDDADLRRDHLYYLAGVRELIRRGEPRAAVFPLWRTFKACRKLLCNSPFRDELARDMTDLAERLGQATDAQLTEKAAYCQKFGKYLETHADQLLEHMGKCVAAEGIKFCGSMATT